MSTKQRPWLSGLAFIAALATAGTASAQTDPEQFTFSADPHAVSWLDGATPLGHFEYSVGLGMHLGAAPFEICTRDPDTDDCMPALSGDIVGERFTSELVAGFGLGRFDVRAALPLVLFQGSDFEGSAGNEGLASAGVGDLRLGGKAWLYKMNNLVVSGDASLTLPLTDGANFIGSSGTVFHPRAIVEWRKDRISAVGSAGYRWRQRWMRVANLYIDDELTWAVAGEYEIQPDKLSAGLSVFGAIGVMSDPMDPSGGDGSPGAEERPVEALASARYWINPNLAVEAGAGTGLTEGYGAPRYRVLAGVRWVNKVPKGTFKNLVSKVLDSDGDGIVDDKDSCPKKPEDIDSFQDEDGCPDLDNDEDGIADTADKCPNDREDMDSFEDTDGCPDLDNDKDGIADGDDKCANEAEDIDSFQDEDGCPDLDNDADTIADTIDKCPLQAEDMDKFEDEDGCPDLDNDQDGIADVKDKCPLQAEVYNGIDDEDGCPDKGRTILTVTASGITIEQKIFFALNRARIRRRSYKILNVVVQVLNNNSTLRIRVEGHTDSRGSAERNQVLSQKRAEAVMSYFVKKGIAADRLEAKGFGPSRPLMPGKSRKAHDKNRRVEFISIPAVAAPAPVPPTPATPAPATPAPAAPETQPSAPSAP